MADTYALNADGAGTTLQAVTIPALSFTSSTSNQLFTTITNPRFNHVGQITITVGGTGPLTGFKVTTASKIGGTHGTGQADATFATASYRHPFCDVAAPHSVTTGATFQVLIDWGGVREAKVYVKTSANTTVAAEIS